MRFSLFILTILMISCEEPLDFCNVMDNGSNCYEEPNTTLLNYYDFEDTLNNTDIILHVEGNNTPAGFAYNLDNQSYWIDTTNIEGIIRIENLSEGAHNILIRSYYPEGEFDPSPISLDFIINAIDINFSSETCLNNSLQSNTLKYQLISDSFINGQKTHLFSNNIIYTWTFDDSITTSSYITSYVYSPCYTFNQNSDSTYYDVTLLIDTQFSSDTLIKNNFIVIPPFNNAGSGGF